MDADDVSEDRGGSLAARCSSALRRSWLQSISMVLSRRLSDCSPIGRDGGLPGNSRGDGLADGGMFA
jgi:hypothetical protein